jgi:ankyrin repeat protein
MRSAFVNETERAKRELENGADVMTSNVQAGYRNSLHLACGGISAPPMLLTFLSDIRTNPIGVDGGGSNGLHFVANSGRIDTTSALLVPSDTDSELVKLNKKLIRENINACDLEGNTALHACAMANSRPVSRIQVIVLLLTLGADKTITNNNGQTAQQLAESRNNTVIIDALNKSHQEQIASPVILTAFNNTTNSQQQTSVIATSVRNDATTTAKSMM